MHFLQPAIISPLLCPNILLSALFSNPRSRYSSLNARANFHAHTKLHAKAEFCIFSFFLESTRDDRKFGLNDSKHYLNLLCY
jgi:hypothetical protein